MDVDVGYNAVVSVVVPFSDKNYIFVNSKFASDLVFYKRISENCIEDSPVYIEKFTDTEKNEWIYISGMSQLEVGDLNSYYI